MFSYPIDQSILAEAETFQEESQFLTGATGRHALDNITSFTRMHKALRRVTRVVLARLPKRRIPAFMLARI